MRGHLGMPLLSLKPAASQVRQRQLEGCTQSPHVITMLRYVPANLHNNTLCLPNGSWGVLFHLYVSPNFLQQTGGNCLEKK